MKSVTFPSNGPITHASLTTIAPLVAGNLILAVGMIFNLGVTSYALGLLVRIVLSVLPADTIVIELTQISVYLTTDVPRTRAYSVNNTNTPHVRFPAGTVCSHLDSPINWLGHKFRDPS